MNKSYFRQLFLNILLLIIVILNSIFNFLNSYTLILFLFIFNIFASYFIGIEKDNKRYKKDIIIRIIIYGLFYYVILFLLGLMIGFNRNPLSSNILPMLKNILPIILTVPLVEYLRNTLMTKGYIYKSILVLMVLSFIMLDLTLILSTYRYGTFNLIFLIIIPSISRNIFQTYLVHKVGYKPSIVYGLLFRLPIIMLPIYPTFGTYIDSLIGFLSPFILMFIIYLSFNKIKHEKELGKDPKKPFVKLVYLFSVLFILMIIFLTSGLFKYYVVTIATGSMKPGIQVGDVVIVEQLKEKELNKIKINDVLVYKHDNKVIVHRIIKILDINKKKYYYTKGDNNESPDGYPIEVKDIIGIGVSKIPYVGLPAVELNKLMSKK